MQRQNINHKGFTIIEVILVLAIGSLIILMALVALPSLQSSQRDQQRKTDYAMLESAITSYTSNNRGKLPTSDAFVSTYIKDTWEDPTKGNYTITVYDGSTKKFTTQKPSDAGQVFIIFSAKCNGENAVLDSALGNRRYAIYAYLESGTFCQAD